MLSLLIKICSLVLGIAAAAGLYFLTGVQTPVSGALAGVIHTAKVICIGLILFAIYEWILKKLVWSILFPKPVRWLLAILLGGALITAALLETAITVAAGHTGYPAPDDECIVVPGDPFRNGQPPPAFYRKLNTVLKLRQASPHLPVLVSGGTMPGDRCSQAEAMKQYLISRGVPADQIMVEDTALSLTAFFRRIGPVLDARFGPLPHRVVLVTEAHKIFRAARIGRRAAYRITPHAPAADWRSWCDHPAEWGRIIRSWFTP